MLIGSNKFEPPKQIWTDSAALKRTQKKSPYSPQKNLPKIDEISEPNINQPERSISVYGLYSGVLNSLGMPRWEIYLLAEVLVVSSCMNTVSPAILPLSLISSKLLPYEVAPLVFIHCLQADNIMTLLEGSVTDARRHTRSYIVVWIQEGH